MEPVTPANGTNTISQVQDTTTADDNELSAEQFEIVLDAMIEGALISDYMLKSMIFDQVLGLKKELNKLKGI